jgi:hypothetical protein
MFLLKKNLRIEKEKDVKIFLILKKHININKLIKINIHIFKEFPKLIPVSVNIKFEKYFLNTKKYCFITIKEEITITIKENNLFLKIGLKLKQDI